jgi:hypothetical protein
MALVDDFASQTGWRVRLHDAPHQEALARAALEALPPEARALGVPALHLAEKRVALKLEAPLPSAQRQAAQEAFVARTGFRLDLGDEPPPPRPPLLSLRGASGSPARLAPSSTRPAPERRSSSAPTRSQTRSSGSASTPTAPP